MLTIELDASAIDRATELLRKLPEALIEAMRKANANSSAYILERIKTVKLRGNPLNRRKGHLIRSWSVIKPVREEGGWRGGVGSNPQVAPYAAAHEFGVDKTQDVMVRAHTRKVTQVFGRPVRNVVAEVGPFQRAQHTKLPARPYARPAFAETAERIRATHHDAIRQAWEKAK